MQSYQPNTLLSDRFLLKEQLSSDPAAGQQVWAVTDTRTGQPLIARFHSNGHIDWYNDNRAATPPTAPPAPEAPAPEAYNTAPPARTTKSQAPSPQRKGAGIWIALLLLAGAGVVAYFNQDLIIGEYEKLAARFSAPADSAGTPAAQSPATEGQSTSLFGQTGDMPGWDPEPGTTGWTEGETTGSFHIVDAARAQFDIIARMNPFDEISGSRDSFRRMQSLLKELGSSAENPALCDSIYAIATDRADVLYNSFKSGSADLKENVLEWYKTSNAARPTDHNRKRIAELQAKKPLTRESAPTVDYFPKDPELNLD